MLRTLPAILLTLLCAVPAVAQGPQLTTNREKVSYAIGMNIGNNLKEQDPDLDYKALVEGIADALKDDADAKRIAYVNGVNIGQSLSRDKLNVKIEELAQGIADSLAGKENPITPEEFQKAFTAYRAELTKVAKAKNAAFFVENAKREGVKQTKSGLQYQLIRAGKGNAPKESDTVRVHYKGVLLSGEQFDSSYDRGQPAQFPLNGVIAGWTEGLQLIREGGAVRLFVPSDLAYGESGRPGIPPNSVLIFDVELLEIVDEQPAPRP